MRIQCVSDNPLLDTGFGTLIRAILWALHQAGHEIWVTAWAYDGVNPINHNPNAECDIEGNPLSGEDELPYQCRPLTGESRFGADRIEGYIDAIKPDVILAQGDPAFISDTYPGCRGSSALVRLAYEKGIPLVAYLAIDSHEQPEWVGQDIEFIDYPVVYTKWAANALHTQFPKIAGKIKTIYPGVKNLKYMGEKEKQILRDELPANLQEKTHILYSVFRNQERKGTGRLLAALRLLLAKRQDWVMIFHTMKDEPLVEQSLPLSEMIRRPRLKELLPFIFFETAPVPGTAILPKNQALNRSYGMADAYLCASKREGFCLPIGEAAMVGRPTIATDYGPMHEILTQNRGWLVPLIELPEHNPVSPYGQSEALVDVLKLTETIDHVLDADEERDERASRCRSWFVENCSWERIGPQWVELFEEIERNINGSKGG